jgi:undecaprenyl-diphosphatase
VVAIVGFLAIADNVLADRELAAFDVAFADALRAQTSPGWRDAFRVVTWLGTGWAITPAAGVVLWVLLARGHRLLAVMWVISQGGSALLNYAMKSGFGRARPVGADPSLFRSDLSFPSGHAMGSLVLCGVAAYLLVRLVPSWRSRVVPMALLLAFPVVMGFSRLYLGVHYVSDVIGGYLAGTAWIAVCVSGAEVSLRRGTPSARVTPGGTG